MLYFCIFQRPPTFTLCRVIIAFYLLAQVGQSKPCTTFSICLINVNRNMSSETPLVINNVLPIYSKTGSINAHYGAIIRASENYYWWMVLLQICLSLHSVSMKQWGRMFLVEPQSWIGGIERVRSEGCLTFWSLSGGLSIHWVEESLKLWDLLPRPLLLR